MRIMKIQFHDALLHYTQENPQSHKATKQKPAKYKEVDQSYIHTA
jgi:hypothetical protein